ncbi:hypothetical protein SEUCBS139899_007161 [Sporothrix eucalyptigena]
MSTTVSSTELVKAYRSLYRSALRAVQFSKPARYIVRDQLRAAFRGQRTPLTSAANNEGGQPFDAKRIRRTVWFLNSAAAYRGIEHRIVSNLIKTAYWRRRQVELKRMQWTDLVKIKKKKKPDVFQDIAYDHYDETVKMLNDQMNIYLR